MKQNATNEFKDGLNLDLHPIVTPNTVLTDNLNGTFITYNGNEFCLQNDRGNKEVAKLNDGYTPIGIKEHNGILYIVSVNENKTEIGTYPKVDWNQTKGLLDYNNYGPLYNYNEHVVYCIWSHYDGEELEREEISIDFQLLNSILDEYDCTVSPSLFGDPGPNQDRIEFNKESDMDNCYARLNTLWPNVFGKGAVDRDYDDETFVLAPMRFRSSYSIKTPLTIEVQDSYDGSVNLILVADGQQTRIINTAFSAVGNEYELIDRNQTSVTNYYRADRFDKETELIRTSNILTNIDLLGVQSGGQFKGGNYTFYIKFGDADYNQTDVVAESGIVSIFNGNDGVPSTISGTLADERTDKMIHLQITGLNKVYSKIYIYYSREYSDTQGYRMTEYGMFNEPIDIKPDIVGNEEQDYQSIWLTGFEQMVPINSEELNVDYHTIDWARAETQHSNMLFLGNVGQKETFKLYSELKDLSEDANLTWGQTTLDAVSSNYDGGTEYYDVKNIYNSLGYYPDELYRFGIVYILKDGSKTPVFNIGKNKGVYKCPKLNVISNDIVQPIFASVTIPNITNPSIIGWFVVRQKRIPNTICEGLSIAIDSISNTPMVWDGKNWISQSFLAADRNNSSEIVQLEYNSVQKDVNINNTETFEEWFENNQYKYDDFYWLNLNEQGNRYSVGSDYTWDDSQTKHLQITNAVKTIVDRLNLNRAYSVFTSITNYELNDADEEKSYDSQLDALKNGSVMLYWYRKMALSEVDEHKNPTDVTTDQYIVGIISGLQDFDSIPVSAGNANYYNILKNRYEAQYINFTLQRKFIKNTLAFSKEANALLSLDPCVKSEVSSMLDGSKYYIEPQRKIRINAKDDKGEYNVRFTTDILEDETITESFTTSERCVFIPQNTNIKVIDDYEFSNIAGVSSDVSKYKAFTTPFFIDLNNFQNDDVLLLKAYELLKDELEKSLDPKQKTEFYRAFYSTVYGSNKNINLLRGLFTPYIGIANKKNVDQGIYAIKHKSELNTTDFNVREQDNSEYYAVTDYININNNTTDVYRGDCYTNTVTMRIIRNFIDSTAPATDIILDPDGWYNYIVKRNKESSTDDARVSYEDVNLADVNTVDLGYWVTFKCLSSYNLGLRSVDRFHEDEMALLGSPRSFYPLNGASTATGNKMEESFLLNDGLSATVGRKRYNLMPDVPYSKSEFSNRIMFSNVNITDAFTNGYRTFQGLAYKDYDKQYGAITKLISLGQNIFIVMEHGLGLVPVNPKALMQTTTGETIHIYGYGVLPDEMTIISQDYGSKYEHSVIRTPIGIYGIDVDAKKIWRFSDKQGFETISDMKIETYLKDNLKSQEIEMGNSDIRTHYNGKKGDLMFTWYHNGEIYSICYNERQNLWVTRYDWTPIVSENINDEFYSLNRAFIAGTEESDPTYSSDYRIWDHYYEVGWDKENKIHTHVSTWYDNDRGFEFEFVVSDPIGINKIFENLQIISNNVSPEELQITIIGDDYTFKRDEITPDYERKEYPDNVTWTTSNIHKNDKEYRELENTVYKWDWRLHQMAVVNTQKLRDIYKHGRRLGNMQYKNGMWFIQIDPLRFNINVPQQKKEVRIRDKWAKIRIRYSGKDLAIITAIRTLINV